MSIATYNTPHIDALVSLLRGGNIALVVGAGTSIACGYPGWEAFLDDVERPLHRKLRDDYLQALRQHDPRTRLDEMALSLGDEYPNIFFRTFSPRGTGEHTPDWIRLLFDLPVRLLLTTNYTAELEEAARFHPSCPLGHPSRPVRWYDSDAVSRALRRTEGRLPLIYLHGRFDDRPSLERDSEGREWSRVILGEKSYRYAYAFPGVLRDRFAAVGQLCTLLVVGASFRDDDLSGTLRFLRALSGSDAPPHFAIVPLALHLDPHSAAADYLNRFGIQPIFYPLQPSPTGHVTHSAIEDLLRELVDRSAAAVTTRISSTEPDSQVLGTYPPQPRIVHALLRARDFEPRPLYLDAIDLFLRQPAGGVLALIGIGGAGKTALVREALADILVRPDDFSFAGLFVWSFYDEPDISLFFRNLADYLTGASIPADESDMRAYEEIRRACPTGARFLFVVDGLERLQVEQSDRRTIHGSIENPLLRQFLLWLAQAPVAARALVTTRFPLPDLETEANGDRARLIEIDLLTRPQARALLRRRGVVGNDRTLDLVLDYFGAHALTVDHLAGVLTLYFGGDARRFRELSDTPLTRFEAGNAGAKLVRVLAAYQGYLARSEPEVRDTLQRVSIFPRPIGLRLLAAVFLKAGREPQAGSLANKTRVDLHRYLRRLEALRLVREERISGEEVYSLHPAIRDAVLEYLGTGRPALAVVAREEMEANLDRVAGRPGVFATAKAALDFVEDLIFFLLDEGDFPRALQLYLERLGGYTHLGLALGEYTRGERITRRLLEASDVTQSRSPIVASELAQFLLILGFIDDALTLFHANLQSSTPSPLAILQLAKAELVAGRLVAAANNVNYALGLTSEAGDFSTTIEGTRASAIIVQATVALESGYVPDALACFKRIVTEYRTDESGTTTHLPGVAGFALQLALLRLSDPTEALTQSRSCLIEARQLNRQDDVAKAQLIQAEALRWLGRLDEAAPLLKEAREWAISAAHQEIVLWARLFGARLARDLRNLPTALDEASEGLRVADSCGYGLLRVDLLVLLADLALAQGDTEEALKLADRALGFAESHECAYFWGRLSANEVLFSAYNALGARTLALERSRLAEVLRARIQLPEDLLAGLRIRRDPSHLPPRNWGPGFAI